jgi:hypothetical protein
MFAEAASPFGRLVGVMFSPILGFARPSLSKEVVEGDGLSTSIIPKAQLQERRQTEQQERSLEAL